MTTELTAAAISKIEELAVLASGAKSVSVTFERGRAKVFNSKDGSLAFVPIPELPPVVDVRGIEDLKLTIDDYGKNASCWVASDKVVVFFDATRTGEAVLRLKLNPAIGVLSKLRDVTPIQLRRALRVDLFDVATSPDDFCESISILKFEATQTNELNLRKGDESIGKTVRSKVTAESDIPESVTFRIEVYPDLTGVETEVSVTCAVVPDATAGTLSVIPYPGEIDRAISFAVEAIAEELRQRVDGLRVYCGSVLN